MASYASRVRSDIARWRQTGLIDAPTAEALVRDIEANERKSLSFGSILAMMAALLFGAAILIFVAANWEAIPRLVRVAALFTAILAGYVGGAVLKTRDHAAMGEALWIVAAAAFGGSIALIGRGAAARRWQRSRYARTRSLSFPSASPTPGCSSNGAAFSGARNFPISSRPLCWCCSRFRSGPAARRRGT